MIQKSMITYPVSQKAIEHLRVTEAVLSRAHSEIAKYAPAAQIDPQTATYVAMGPNTGITQYLVTMQVIGCVPGSLITVTYDARFTLQSILIVLGIQTATGVRGMAIENGVVKVDQMTGPSDATAITETENPITCFWNCLNAMGIPNWLLSLASALCAAVCIVSDLLACPPCVFGVLAGYAGEVSFCAGACGF